MKTVYTKFKVLFICAVSFSATNLMGQNLLLNPSFESGVLAPWTAGNNSTVNIIEDPINGVYAAEGNIEQIVNLEAGVEYTYEIYVKNATPDLNVWAGIRNIVDDNLVGNFKITNTEYELASITFTSQSAGQYRFWVYGVNDTQYVSDYAILLKAGTTTSTSEADFKAEKINISNSVDGILVNIDTEINSGTISLFDLSGRQVYSQKANQGETFIDTRSFSLTGMYMVTVQADRAIKTERIIIAN